MFAKNALIVDDSSTARMMLRRHLSQFDIMAELACDGSQALEMLRDHKPDMIFLDHVMPGLDGFQVLTALKNNEATCCIPVVMYTSQAAPQYINEARSLGAVAVIPKDVTDEQLVDVLNKVELYQLTPANDDMSFAERRHPGTSANAGAADTPARQTPPGTVPAHRRAGRVPPRAAAPLPALTASRGLVLILLVVLAAAQAYASWRSSTQERIIDDLRTHLSSQNQEMAQFRAQLEYQQFQINEANSRQVEMFMNLLVSRIEK